MKAYDRQAAEIATVKPRTFTIELSDADVKRLYEKAYSDGITPGELLAGFIGDLVSGTYTHGSDERMLADNYYERCCYDIGLERNFLQWALHEYRLDDILTALDDMETAENDLAYYEDYPEEAAESPDDLQAVKDAKADAESELREIYQEYTRDTEKPQALEDGLQAIREYLEELQAMTERGQLDE